MRTSIRSIVAVILCSFVLTACADENGNSATPPPLAGATGAGSTASGAATTNAPASASSSGCPAISPSGPQDSFTTQVALTTGADGLQSGDITVGSGTPVAPHQSVTVQYTGWLDNGSIFDTSRQAGRTPAEFGLDGVIKGWTEGLVGMKPGGKRRLVIPGPLAYGKDGRGCIPPNATLTFDIELISAK